jgi:putative hydrolase of the HAD superfamily
LNFVFDFGGVVFDWQPQALIERVLSQRTRSPAEAQHWTQAFFQGFGGDWNAFDRGLVEVPALVERIAARTGLAPDEVRAVIDAVPDALQPRLDTVQWLRRLKADGHRLTFLSNMPAPYAQHLQRRHAFLAECFDDGVFSAHVRLAKPDAELFALAQRRFGIARADDCLFFDDHLPYVEAARAFGWRALHFRDAASAEAALRS